MAAVLQLPQADGDLAAYYAKQAGSAQTEISLDVFHTLLLNSPVAVKLHLTGRLVGEFLEAFLATGGGAAHSPAPAAARASGALPHNGQGKSVSAASGRASPTKTLLQRARNAGRSSSHASSSGGASSPTRMSTSNSPSPTREMLGAGAASTRNRSSFTLQHFSAACRELEAFAQATFSSTIIVGNGRSVLGSHAGPAVDSFSTVIRFNDFQIDGFEEHVGQKTDMWVVSDWTCIKLLNKYPDRVLPTLIAVPWKFMGKPYYHERRAEVERDLTPEQRSRCSFVPAECVERLVRENTFGDRWPSSGLITIVYMLSLGGGSDSLHQLPGPGGGSKVHLHGFDFFKEIDGKIHYMEDTHKANHHAREEERICMDLVQQHRVSFIA